MDLIGRIIRKAQRLGSNEPTGEAPARNGVHAAGVQAGAVEIKPGTRRTFFFVSGHPRSGTNWISNLCNLHPDICCHGEFHFEVMYEALERFTNKPWYLGSLPHIKPVAEHALEQFVHRTLNAMADKRKPGARIVGDHTPKPFKLQLADGAYIVALRDGRDVVVSWTFHLLRTGMTDIVHDEARETFAREMSAGMDDPEKLKTAAQNLLRDQEWVTRLSAGWSLQIQNDLPAVQAISASGGAARVMIAKYEAMLSDVEGERARLYEFLGAAPDKALPISRETRTAPGFGREDPTHFFRKGESGDWKNYFDERTAGWFKACAGQQLIDAGYEKDERW
jgi:hypothetical protein